MSITLKEEMALAVLRGDNAAAYGLADLLIAELNEIEARTGRIERGEGVANNGAYNGYDVYSWPEFRALMTRFDFDYFGRVRWLEIRIAEGEFVSIKTEFLAGDRGEGQSDPGEATPT